MFFSKQVQTEEQEGISWINGKIRFQSITLNVYSYSVNGVLIDTPGHSIDHKAFLNCDTGQIFTGDLFISQRTMIVLAEEGIPATIHSLKRLLKYDFGSVFCSHAGFIGNGRKAVEQKGLFNDSST